MAAQTGKSKLLAKYGSRINQMIQAHVNDETDYGPERLPPGITGGIAKLVKCYFDEFKTGSNQGQLYFRAEGRVVEPDAIEHNGMMVTVAGKITSIMVPICETKNSNNEVTSQEDNLAKALNEIRKLGGEEAISGIAAADGLEGYCAQLAAAGIFFKFSTSARKPRPGTNDQPGVWENWHGSKGLENYSVEANYEGDVTDNSSTKQSAKSAPAPAPKANGHVQKPAVAPGKPAAATSPAKLGKTPIPAPEPASEAVGDYREDADIDSLIEKATNGDEEAVKQITDMAKAVGLEKEVDEARDWREAWDILRPAYSSDVKPDIETPEVGSIHDYTPSFTGPNGKSVKQKKAVKVEVLEVNTDNNTCVVKNKVDNKTTYKNVAWEDLK